VNVHKSISHFRPIRKSNFGASGKGIAATDVAKAMWVEKERKETQKKEARMDANTKYQPQIHA
jgi:hypothetical protein